MNLIKLNILNSIENRFINNLNKTNFICIYGVLYNKKNINYNCGLKDECKHCTIEQFNKYGTVYIIQKIIKMSNKIKVSSFKSLLGYCDNCTTKYCNDYSASEKSKYIAELNKILKSLSE